MLAPTLIGMLIFSYWPKLDTFRYAFYEWVPGAIKDYTGFNNFRDAWNDELFASAFALVGVLLVANVFKMIPSIAGAILLHRLKSDRARYLFQICFVVPMIIPGLVWLLLWKGFMDPNVGLVNAFLNATGLMSVLAWLDHHWYLLANAFYPISWSLDALLTSTAGPFQSTMSVTGVARQGELGLWAALVAGCIVLVSSGSLARIRARWMLMVPLVVTAFILMQAKAFVVVPLLLFVAWVIRSRAPSERIGESRVSTTGWILTLVACLLLFVTRTWSAQTGVFDNGQPSWLGHSELIVPAVIFWGFPWIHAVGVLIYLAGLQQISTDVYEAAELDGMTSLGKVFRLELPLILTQIRINLIFMTIATLNSYGFFLILLGPTGGPGGKGLVPGLYMYQQAFVANRYGYACALGLVVFFVILLLTIIYQRHVKVDK